MPQKELFAETPQGTAPSIADTLHPGLFSGASLDESPPSADQPTEMQSGETTNDENVSVLHEGNPSLDDEMPDVEMLGEALSEVTPPSAAPPTPVQPQQKKKKNTQQAFVLPQTEFLHSLR